MIFIRDRSVILIGRRFYNFTKVEKCFKKMRVIDLRSDTFTKPSKAMREAMFNAQVGDDVFDEDPTVKALEKCIAEMTGKESAIFVASGTMGNLLSVLTHCNRRGSEIILGDESHIYHYEQGNIAQFGGILCSHIPTNKDGTLNLNRAMVRKVENDFHHPTTQLLAVENTQNRYGGKVLPISWLKEAREFTTKHGLKFHMDGARVFNASVQLGVPVSEILKYVDSASICLSKGLGAPIGSLIVGQTSFIERVKQLRKAIGGGWRQAGVIAACGLYALQNNIERLADDHHNATLLADGINSLNSKIIKVKENATNMVIVQVDSIEAGVFCSLLAEANKNNKEDSVVVQAFDFSKDTIRFVTHLDVSKQDIEAALVKIANIVKDLEK